MNNFNLLISSSRYNEINAEAELWFTLLICGDKYPIISKLDFPGLITAATNLNNRDILLCIKDIMIKDPTFFKFILKIVPIDYVCETNLNFMKEFVKTQYSNYIDEKHTFRIDLKRRKSKIIERESFIKTIANIFDNKVNLDFPDKIIRFEILGNISGISFLEPNDIISITEEY
jgi:tRNA(Ser,Leu) C12 N-acetylase TAN1